jgi:hypothetical protein
MTWLPVCLDLTNPYREKALIAERPDITGSLLI